MVKGKRALLVVMFSAFCCIFSSAASAIQNSAQAPAKANQPKENEKRPCMLSANARQFDFWVGEWEVTDQKGQKVGTSIIQLIEDGCIILENWTDAEGGSGKSINFYDAHLSKWRQTWVSSIGGVSEFSGEFKDGAMRFEGESHTPNGKKILRRLTFFNLAPDKVRQYSEYSKDEGKTWAFYYDFTYSRKR